MSAMVDQVLSSNVLTDGPGLYQMLKAAFGALTVSPNLGSLADMAGLALSLRSLDAQDITFVTTPYAAYAPDPARLVFDDEEVQAIWEAMREDVPIPTASSEATDGRSAEDVGGSSTDTAAPEDQRPARRMRAPQTTRPSP